MGNKMYIILLPLCIEVHMYLSKNLLDVLFKKSRCSRFATYNFTKPFSLLEDPKANFILFEIINYIQM